MNGQTATQEKRQEGDDPAKMPSSSSSSSLPVFPKNKKARMRRTWEESFQALAEYKEKHGNCNVPYAYAEDSSLGTWVSNARVRWEQLTGDQRQRLSQLGLNSAKRHEREEQAWNDAYRRLKAFRREHGHCRVPCRFKEDPHLGRWVDCQRQLQKKKRLASHRLRKLEAIHFTWTQIDCKGDTSTNDKIWMQKYEELVQFQAEHGHFIVPQLRTGRKRGLAIWAIRQRALYRHGELRQDRKELLQAIGFPWDCKSQNKGHCQDNGNDWDKEVAPETSRNPRREPLRASCSRSDKAYQANCDEEMFKDSGFDTVEVLGSHEELSRVDGGARMLKDKSSQKTNDSSRKSMRNHAQPRYPIGLQFVKQFVGHGSFEGRIAGFDGRHYKVFYPADGDEEEMSEWEFELDENVHITTHIPVVSPSLEEESVSGHVALEDQDNTPTKNRPLPRYPIGLQFVKQFVGHGCFEGRITGFDGKHYNVFYPEDGDEEVMSESEFELDRNVQITTHIPLAGAALEVESMPGLVVFDDGSNTPRSRALQPKPPLHLVGQLNKRPADESGGYDSDEEEEYEFQ